MIAIGSDHGGVGLKSAQMSRDHKNSNILVLGGGVAERELGTRIKDRS